MEEILKETKDIVEEICEKYGYDSEDKEGNDSLKTVLLKAIPAMLKNAKPKERQIFYKMLRHTPIVITENITREGLYKLKEQYIGNINPHIVNDNTQKSELMGAYGKKVGDGAYVSEPIIDENMQVIGKKSFIYIQKVQGKQKEFFGTDINVPHLQHELGHAWNAEENQFIMQEDGTLKNRVGITEKIYAFSKGEDGKNIIKLEKASGIMIEEGMNTIAEQEAFANYMGMSEDKLEEVYTSNILIRSIYQADIKYRTQYMLKTLNKEDFEKWRMYGDSESKTKIEGKMKETEYWKNRENDILPNSGNPRSYDKKREVISKIEDPDVQKFFKEYEDVYFPDIGKMTPLEKIDNVLEQAYTMEKHKYSFRIDNYKDLLTCMDWEIFSLINQTTKLIEKEEIVKNTVLKAIETVTLSEVNRVVEQTRSRGEMQKQGGISR